MGDTVHPSDVPAGFEPLFRSSPFLDLVGPFYSKRQDEGFVVGARVREVHANARGSAHGGLLLTLADIALGYGTAFSHDPPAALTTINISADFAGSARMGEWVEAHVDVQRLGERVAFANAYLMANQQRIARVSGIFSRTPGTLGPTPAASPPRSRPG